MLRFSLLVLMVSIATVVDGQRQLIDNIYDDRNFKDAIDFHEEHLFGQSRRSIHHLSTFPARKTMEKPAYNDIKGQVLYHIAGLHLRLPQAEASMVKFIDGHRSSPLITDAIFALADYYYNNRRYTDAVTYFEMVDIDKLTPLELSEYSFKLGYAHFVQKQFKEAIINFSFGRDQRNKFFYPINYYYGMAKYFLEEYDAAIASFRRVEGSSVYKQYIPYYITQVYYNQGDEKQLITYGEQIAHNPAIKNRSEIQRLLGQVYFNRGDYNQALPYLEYYEAHTEKLSQEEFYQLAFAQYQTGQYAKAKDNFLQLSNLESKMGQVSAYYLAKCFLELDNKSSARSAFRQASKMSYDKALQEEAIFNYGKLSSELGYEREAMNILVNIQPSTLHYDESRIIINDILAGADDHDNTLKIIESLPSINKDLELTYQRAALLRGLQKMNERSYEEAKQFFQKSLTYPVSPMYEAQVYFWNARISMLRGETTEAISFFERYHNIASSGLKLPDESSVPVHAYYRGYIAMESADYERSSRYFSEAVDKGNQRSWDNTSIRQRILPDAMLRAADSYFMLNNYAEAGKIYKAYIQAQYPNYSYALYQYSIIQGLTGDRQGQIASLQKIRDEHPRSDYADDALLELGNVYFNEGNSEAAVINLQALVSKYGETSTLTNEALLKLGLISYNNNEKEKAIDFYKQVVKGNASPQQTQEAMKGIEEIYVTDMGRPKAFIEYVETIPGMEVTAYSIDSLNYKPAENRFNFGNYPKAIESFNYYIEEFPNGRFIIPAYYNRGESYLILKNYEQALENYVQVVNYGNSDYYQRALKKAALISYNYVQDFTKALALNKQLAEFSGDENEVYTAQTYALRSAFRTGSNDDVLVYAEKVRNNPLATRDDQATANYYLGKVRYNRGEKAGAVDAFERVKSLINNNHAAEANYLIAKTSYDDGQYEKAENYIKEGNEKYSAYPRWIAKNLLLFADIHLVNKDFLNARAATEAVIENFTADEEVLQEANAKLTMITTAQDQQSRLRSSEGELLEMDSINLKND